MTPEVIVKEFGGYTAGYAFYAKYGWFCLPDMQAGNLVFSEVWPKLRWSVDLYAPLFSFQRLR